MTEPETTQEVWKKRSESAGKTLVDLFALLECYENNREDYDKYVPIRFFVASVEDFQIKFAADVQAIYGEVEQKAMKIGTKQALDEAQHVGGAVNGMFEPHFIRIHELIQRTVNLVEIKKK